jgi:hypothetical protein
LTDRRSPGAAMPGLPAMSELSPTLLFCTSHISSEDAWRARYRPWIDYYQNVPLRRDATYMFDDASPFRPSDARLEIEEALADAPDFSKIRFHRFAAHLGREGLLGHLGWWRSFIYSLEVARRYGFRRIVHVESDAYVLSEAMVDYLNRLDSGWTVLWCERYRMPEPAIQVIAEDQYPAFQRIAGLGVEKLALQMAEATLPFTHVERRFAGNRYGETRSRIPGYADYACQIDAGTTSVVFRGAASSKSRAIEPK